MVTKNQHFVPELLLRRFANETRDAFRTNVYDISQSQFRRNQNVKDLCAGKYTYDKDNLIEKYLADSIESPAGKTISEIINAPMSQSTKPSIALLQFILVQLARTRRAYEGQQEFVNKFMGTIFTEIAKLNNLDPEAAKAIRIVPKEPRSVLSSMAIHAAMNYKLIADLAVHVVINQTETEFILCDDPAFQYNWYLMNSEEHLSTSITVLGIQFFIPLSPNISCCLYDPKIYVYGSNRKSYTILTNKIDVNCMNSYQALNAHHLLMAKSEFMGGSLADLGRKYAERTTYSSHASNTAPEDKGDGKLRSTHLSWRKQAPISGMPSFVKIKNKVRRRQVVCADRDPEAVFLHKTFIDELMRQEKRPND